MFVCKRCGTEFKRKDYLINHLNKIKPCEGKYDRELLIVELKHVILTGSQCEYCDKMFKSKQSKCNHKKTCKNKPKTTDEKFEELTNTIQELKEQIKNNNVMNINNNTQINNVSINGIKLRDFGFENMEAVPDHFLSTTFMNLRFKDLIANLHCDPNYPENHNVRLKSTKRGLMELYQNKKWDIMTLKDGLKELLMQGHKIFMDFYKRDKQRILDEDMQPHDLQEVLDDLRDIERNINKTESDIIKPLLTELQLMLEEFRENGYAIALL